MNKKFDDYKKESDAIQMALAMVMVLQFVIIFVVGCSLGFVVGGCSGLGLGLFMVSVFTYVSIHYLRAHSISKSSQPSDKPSVRVIKFEK